MSGTSGLGDSTESGKKSWSDYQKCRYGAGYDSSSNPANKKVKYDWMAADRKAVKKAVPDTSLELALALLLDEAEDLLLTKHKDYGPDNINKSPFGPITGLLVRLYDKQARATHLTKQGTEANFESLEDTFLDMMNYAAIAILVLRKQWPTT